MTEVRGYRIGKPNLFHAKKLAEVVKGYRTAKAITQKRFAERAGLDPSTVNRIERSGSGSLTLETVEKIYKAIRPEVRLGKWVEFFRMLDHEIVDRTPLLEEDDE